MKEQIPQETIPDTDLEALQQEALQLLAEFEQETFYIDKGGAGEVYETTGGACIKNIN